MGCLDHGVFQESRTRHPAEWSGAMHSYSFNRLLFSAACYHDLTLGYPFGRRPEARLLIRSSALEIAVQWIEPGFSELEYRHPANTEVAEWQTREDGSQKATEPATAPKKPSSTTSPADHATHGIEAR